MHCQRYSICKQGQVKDRFCFSSKSETVIPLVPEILPVIHDWQSWLSPKLRLRHYDLWKYLGRAEDQGSALKFLGSMFIKYAVKYKYNYIFTFFKVRVIKIILKIEFIIMLKSPLLYPLRRGVWWFQVFLTNAIEQKLQND